VGTGGTVVLILVVVLVLLALAWAASTRGALVRLRDLAVEAGALAEQRRSRLADLSLNRVDAHREDGEPDTAARRAVEDAERRLAGDVAFHAAAVRAYDHRLAGVPTSWVAALTGMHPLGAAADHQG
jgi:uncharacterized iron-regulated membrane protein